jgi:cell division protein FtsB
VTDEHDTPLTRRSRRVLWLGLTAVTVLVVFAIGIVPLRQYLAQRGDIAQRRSELAALDKENGRLRASADALQSDDEIIRIARSEYGMAFAGEETYAVLSPQRQPDAIPSIWPFDN